MKKFILVVCILMLAIPSTGISGDTKPSKGRRGARHHTLIVKRLAKKNARLPRPHRYPKERKSARRPPQHKTKATEPGNVDTNH